MPGAGHGNGQWMRSAVDRYERPLILYTSRLLGDPDAACDVVQEAFLRLCREEPQRVSPHLAEWLFTVCRNLATDLLRKDRRMRQRTSVLEPSADDLDEVPDTSPDPSRSAESRDTTATVLTLLEKLPPNQREVIRLKFQGGLSYQEIANVTGLSVSNVGFLMHTGLKTLRKQMSR